MCLIASKPRGPDRSESPPRPPRPSRVTRQSAKSVSRYDDEHVMGSRSTTARPRYLNDLRGHDLVLGRDENAQPPHTWAAPAFAPSTSGDDDEHLISSRPHRVNTTVTHGMSKSRSVYDDEHVISSVKDLKKEAAKKDGSVDGGLLGMLSGESSYGKEREGRRIGEKFIGMAYGPGSFLTGRSSLKQTKEAKKAKTTARPREYGF